MEVKQSKPFTKTEFDRILTAYREPLVARGHEHAFSNFGAALQCRVPLADGRMCLATQSPDSR